MNRRQKGTGSVWKDEKTNRYKGQIQIGYLANGNRKYKTVSGKTAKEVKIKLEKIKAEMLTDSYIDTSNLTIPELAYKINDEKYKLNQIKISSYTRNVHTINIINDSMISKVNIQDITEYTLKTFYSSIVGYSNSVIGKVYNQVNQTLKKAIKLNIIKYNLNEDIKMPKSNKETKKISAFTIDEQKKFIQAINEDGKEPYRTMLLLSLFTGMRMGEICVLQLSNYNANNQTLHIERTITRSENDKFVIGSTTKTYAGNRTIKIPSFVCTLLDNYISDNNIKNGLIFTINGSLINTGQVNLYFKRLIERYDVLKIKRSYKPISSKLHPIAFKPYTFYIKKDNIYQIVPSIPDDWNNTDKYYFINNESLKPYNQHMLRHTYATRSIESGVSAKVLQKKMGHQDIKVTLNTYSDVFALFEDQEDMKLSKYLKENNIL